MPCVVSCRQMSDTDYVNASLDKRDMEEECVVSLEEGREPAKQHRLSHFETSTKSSSASVATHTHHCTRNPRTRTPHTHERTHPHTAQGPYFDGYFIHHRTHATTHATHTTAHNATQRTSHTLTVVVAERACSAGDHAVARGAQATIEHRKKRAAPCTRRAPTDGDGDDGDDVLLRRAPTTRWSDLAAKANKETERGKTGAATCRRCPPGPSSAPPTPAYATTTN